MSNPTELPDLESLETLARAATPGPWEATRQTDDECCFVGYFIEAKGKTISDDGTAPDSDDAQFIAAANPAVVLALIALARRAQPEGEAPQAELRALHDELNRITWEGEDEGWNLAIAAVQKRIRELLGIPATSAEEQYSAKLANRGAPVAEVRAAERVEAMHKGVVGVFADIKARHLADQRETAPAAQHAESGALAMEADLLARDLDAAALAQDDKHLHGLLVRASVGIKALSAQSQGAQAPTDEEVIAAVHACGVDTHPSKYDLPALQVEATSVPVIRDIYMKLATRAALAAKAEAPAHETIVQQADQLVCAACGTSAQQAAEPGAEPVMWFEAEPSARGREVKEVIGSMLYSTRIHTGKAPVTTNPVWPLYAAPVAAPSAPGTPEAPAPATGVLCIGVAAPKGATVSVIQRRADGTSIVLHTGTHPVGDSMCTLNLASFASFAKTTAAYDVLVERWRQVEVEGYDIENDDAHVLGELGAYAAFYAMPPAARDWPAEETGYGATWGEAIIPADWTAPKPGDRRTELVKAGALVLSEIERLDRAAQLDGGQGEGGKAC